MILNISFLNIKDNTSILSFQQTISLISPDMLVVYVNSPVVELLLYLTESGFIPNNFNISKSLDIVTLSPTEKLLKSIDFLCVIYNI